MANNLFVSVNTTPGSSADLALTEALKPLGAFTRIGAALFYVKSDLTAEQATSYLRAHANGDALAVIDASNNKVAYIGLDPNLEGLLKDQWYS